MKVQLLSLALLLSASACSSPPPSVLVFSKTAGYRHASIEPGVEAVRALGAEHGFLVEATEDSTQFRDDVLSGFDAIVFLSTTQDVLGMDGQLALQRFIQAGGGFVGIHAASDTEYDWPWYGRLVGGYFVSHPPGVYEAELLVADSSHASTAHLPATWIRTDEWYDIRRTTREVNVLLDIDETTYKTPEMSPAGAPRPIAWYQEFDGGRSFYTALGHTIESYAEPAFLDHILGGILWAIGDAPARDYAAARPLDSEYELVTLADSLDEPMELDILPDGRVLFVERKGDVHLVDSPGGLKTAGRLSVVHELEDGLLGLAVDPDFEVNDWIYLFYSPAAAESGQRVSRFAMVGDRLDLDSEHILLEIEKQRVECCHSGGSLQFGPDRLLYISVGDDTNPFASQGFSPQDERAGRAPWDAQRTAANTDDLRGKILRLRITEAGEAEIPDGNLFPADGSRGRPEIYVMGNRNPFRISVDSRNGWLYWGDIGPDAAEDDEERGPRGHDEINQARGPGNFGWPYFIADNRSYGDYDFATGSTVSGQSPAAPFNESVNNTGSKTLPPAQGAFIWYPYGKSQRFPLLGLGGRSAMAGPVYYRNDDVSSASALPEYYDEALFIHEWMRNLILVVRLDRGLQFDYMETFLPSETFSRPVDMQVGPDGVLYILEYGQTWSQANPDARVVRVEHRGA